ncbi:MAG: HD domain-containing protein [Minisyncoccia bacterium]
MSEADKIIELGQLVLAFSRVNRGTYHEDGKISESDTDHTVMLGIIACSVVAKLYPRLDIGKVAQYSLAHDLVEVYAGDTHSFNITPEEKENKDRREKEALETIQKQFSIFPWLTKTIEQYEVLADEESRFVKTLDKCMPKVTHILNKGAYFKQIGTEREGLVSWFEKQHLSLREGYGKEFPELMVLMRTLMDMTIEECFPA